MTREILFLAHRIPYPPDKGDKIRSWHVLRHLCERFAVHLAAFVDDPRDMTHKPFLEEHCASVTLAPLEPKRARIASLAGLVTGRPLSVQYYRDSAMRAAVDAIRARPLAMEYVFSSTMAQYVESAREGRPRIVDFCDSDAEKWRQYAQDCRGPMALVYAREARLLAREETRIANAADASFAVSADEARLFNERDGLARPVDWFANGVDAETYAPAPPAPPQHDCVFVGAMDYRANIDGVLAFMRHVWPLIRSQKPAARFAIVGSNPAPEIRALDGRDGVTVTGRVADVRPWLAGAAVSVAPLRVARGVQNKVLEAMAAGKPVVASPEALTGIAADANCVAVAPIGDGMATTILRLLNDHNERMRMGAAARALVVARYGWPAALKRLDERLAAPGH